MVLEGVVTNVAAFGAFVDIGVHQDGLVHISAMSNTFVKDPRAIAKPGDVVRVKVLDVDVPRKRIALTMRLDEKVERGQSRQAASRGPGTDRKSGTRSDALPRQQAPSAGGALADAFRRAGLGVKGSESGKDRRR